MILWGHSWSIGGQFNATALRSLQLTIGFGEAGIFGKEEEQLTKLVFFSFVQTLKKGSSDVIKSKEEALFSESELAGQPRSIVRMKTEQKPEKKYHV